jgi:ParB-like chromosome segregation protein Spo0J
MKDSTKIEQVNVEKLIPYAKNSRKHSDAQIGQIAASIKEFGFINPILIGDDNTLIAGHGRLLAAQKLELKTVPCIRAKHLTAAQRKAYVIVDNRLSETSEWDKEMLKLEIEDLSLNMDFDLSPLGFSDDEISKLVAAPSDFVPDFGSDSDSQPKKAKLVVEFATLEDMDELLLELKSRGFKVKVG